MFLSLLVVVLLFTHWGW